MASPDTPVPLREIPREEFVASLATTMLPETAPALVGGKLHLERMILSGGNGHGRHATDNAESRARHCGL